MMSMAKKMSLVDTMNMKQRRRMEEVLLDVMREMLSKDNLVVYDLDFRCESKK